MCLLFIPYNSNEDYSLKKGKFLKLIENGCEYINCIFLWYNKNDKTDYIIQIAYYAIYMNNMNEDKLCSVFSHQTMKVMNT